MGNPAYEIKTVDRLLAVLNSGDDGAEATALYKNITETLNARVAQHGGKHKAKLAITIEFIADSKGVDVQIQSEAKMPKKPVFRERFFIKDDTLTLQDPARGSMFEGADLGRGPALARIAGGNE